MPEQPRRTDARREALRRSGRGGALALTLVLASACASPRTPFLVRVTDAASDGAVEGAVVQAHPVNAKHPLDIAAALNPLSPEGVRVRTDALGVARVSMPEKAPLQIFVTAPGFAPWGRFYDRTPERGAEVAVDLSPVNAR